MVELEQLKAEYDKLNTHLTGRREMLDQTRALKSDGRFEAPGQWDFTLTTLIREERLEIVLKGKKPKLLSLQSQIDQIESSITEARSYRFGNPTPVEPVLPEIKKDSFGFLVTAPNGKEVKVDDEETAKVLVSIFKGNAENMVTAREIVESLNKKYGTGMQRRLDEVIGQASRDLDRADIRIIHHEEHGRWENRHRYYPEIVTDEKRAKEASIAASPPEFHSVIPTTAQQPTNRRNGAVHEDKDNQSKEDDEFEERQVIRGNQTVTARLLESQVLGIREQIDRFIKIVRSKMTERLQYRSAMMLFVDEIDPITFHVGKQDGLIHPRHNPKEGTDYLYPVDIIALMVRQAKLFDYPERKNDRNHLINDLRAIIDEQLRA